MNDVMLIAGGWLLSGALGSLIWIILARGDNRPIGYGSLALAVLFGPLNLLVAIVEVFQMPG